MSPPPHTHTHTHMTRLLPFPPTHSWHALTHAGTHTSTGSNIGSGGGGSGGGGGVGGGSTIHVSDSPAGPWSPLQENTLDPNCNNPSPWVHRNGTIYLVCSGGASGNGPVTIGHFHSLSLTLVPNFARWPAFSFARQLQQRNDFFPGICVAMIGHRLLSTLGGWTLKTN